MSNAKSRYLEFFNRKYSDRYELLSEYESSKDKVIVRCKSCGEKWLTKPHRIRCKPCGYKKISEKLSMSHNEYISKVPKDIKCLGQYNGAHFKIRHECTICEHKWLTKPMNILSGRGCPECGKKKNKGRNGYTHKQYCEKVASRFKVLESYIDVNQQILHSCIVCGHKRSVKPSTVLRGWGCPKRCSSKQEYEKKLPENIKLIGNFCNYSSQTLHVCDQGHKWFVMPKDLLKSKGCPKCNNTGVSFSESELFDKLKLLNIPIVQNDRSLLTPQELDIVFPYHNVALEFNGNYWHSTYQKDKNYHKDKTIKCRQLGYRLIHVWEFESSNEIIFSIIKNALGLYDVKIPARKCTVRNIEWLETAKFLDKNHIQGRGASTSHNLGLYYNNDLISVMTFNKPRFKNVSYNWELVRYAAKKNYKIIGGASKLFKFKPDGSIFSYSDCRLFDGGLYERLGFRKDKHVEPSYFYVKNNIAIKRYDTQKKKLPDLLGDRYDPDMTETGNMLAAGFFKIYDSGCIRWVYN